MKLLLLATSAAVPRKGVAEQDLAHNQEGATHDPGVGAIERIVKVAWPNERLPDRVEGWINEFEPDVVLLVVNEYWFNFRSAPASVHRRFGPLGRPAAAAATWAGRHPSIAYSRAFQRVRRLTSDKVGGDAHFEPDQVIASCIDVLRRIARAEGPVPLVIGPNGAIDNALPPAFRAEGINRRVRVDTELQAYCAANHVEYWGIASEVGKNWPGNQRSTVPDGIHHDAAGSKLIFDYLRPHLMLFFMRVMQEQQIAAHERLAAPHQAATF